MAFLLILGAIAKAAAVEDLEAPTIWTRNGGARCYTGHGATNIGSGSVGNVSTAECREQCTQTAGCSGVVQQVARIDWATHTGLNCSAGHGATNLVDGSGTTNDCYRMTLAECRTQCYIIDGCDGITYNPQEGQGLCCLRADIEPARCRVSGSWDTLIMAAASIPEDSRPCFLRTNISIADCDTTATERRHEGTYYIWLCARC